MKNSLSSFDILVLVDELQTLLGGHLDKVYQDDDEFLFKVNLRGGGKAELFLRVGKWLCLKGEEEKPETPPPLAQTLRKHLDNARIATIEQRGFDRVVVIEFERGKGYRLIFELFGKGNLILVEGDDIIACYSHQSFRDRDINVGSEYKFPPAGVNPLDLDREAFRSILKQSKGQVVKVLAGVLNLGGLYAEELCLRAQVAKDTRVQGLKEGDLDALYTALNNLIASAQQDRRPAIVKEPEGPIDVVPIELQRYADLERDEFPTFSDALSRYLLTVSEEVTEASETVEKLRRRAEQQEAALRMLREEETRLSAQTLLLYSHFREFDELLTALRDNRAVESPYVRSIDREHSGVTVSIGEFDEILLDYSKDVNQNAQNLYTRRREVKEKAAKVLAALQDTKNGLEKAKKTAKKIERKPKVKGTRRFWFEAYRWSLSSEGFLCLGGRDAKSNDSVVKRHLKEGDRYAHADVRGAPSVVVKEGSKASEATLKEACEFALCYSKAWNAGVATGSAYWVLPEQVSKRAESGEYLPRGAFVIRGKRNYIHDIRLQIGVGEVDCEGHRKIMGGPTSAVVSRSKKYAILEPGEGRRDVVARRLAAVFAVPIEEVSRVLPSGGVEVVSTFGMELLE